MQLGDILNNQSTTDTAKLDELKKLYDDKKTAITALLTSETNEETKEKKAELLISRIPRDKLNEVLNSQNTDKLQELKNKFREHTNEKIEQNKGKELSNIRRRYLYSALGVSHMALGIGVAVTGNSSIIGSFCWSWSCCCGSCISGRCNICAL